MRWQRAARLGVAAAGLTTAVALYVFTRERPTVERPPAVGPSDPAATTQSGPCVQLRYKGDTEHYRLECGASRTYPDRFEFDQVHMTFKDDGTELWAGLVVARGATGDAAPTSLDMSKGVRLRTGEGASVEGDEATYEDASGLTRIPGAVKFMRGRFSGSGTGAVYERHAGVFRILADARVVSTPAEAGARGAGPASGSAGAAPSPAGAAPPAAAVETPIEATSTSLVFNRAANALMLEGNAVINHKPDKMTADRATLYLSDDGERFRVIELRMNSRVIPDPAGGSKTPDMRAQDIDLAFHDGTQTLQRAVLSGQGRMVLVDDTGRRSIDGNVINLTTAADGTTLTHLDANERVRVEIPASATTPARVITAANLLATGADATGLTAATFSGGVRFVETTTAARGRAASERTGTAQTLVMKLKGKLDSIDEAQFQQNVEFRDGRMTGGGDIGTYSVTAGRLRLESNPRAPREVPWVKDASDGEVQVEAKRFVDIDLNSHNVLAEQDVKTIRTSKPGTAGRGRGRGNEPSGPALFGGDAPIYGFGEQFRYDRAKQVIVYGGTPDKVAHVKQEESDVYGVEITLDDANRDLTAIGKVRSVMPVESSSATAARGRTYTATAERMVYRDRARTVTYNGIPVKLETPEATTLAAEVVLTLMADSNKLDRMRATHDPSHPSTAFVESTLTEGHRTLSEVLEYETATDRYTFTGRGFVLRMRDADGRCSESRGNYGTFTPADRNVVIPLGPRNPGKVFLNTSVPCGDPLKP